MKKMISAVLMLIAFQAGSVHAGLFDQDCCAPSYDSCCDPCCDPCDTCCGMGPFTIAAKFAAFFPLEKRARKIYNHALPNFEVEVATTWCNWQPWFNAGYIWNNGHSTGCRNKTHLDVVPLGLGVNYLFPMCGCIDAYIGAGATYTFLRTRDHSEFVHEHVHKSAWGGIAKAGFYYNYSDCIFFEGFVNYVYTRFRFRTDPDDLPFVERHDVNLSAIKVGVGVGFKF